MPVRGGARALTCSDVPVCRRHVKTEHGVANPQHEVVEPVPQRDPAEPHTARPAPTQVLRGNTHDQRSDAGSDATFSVCSRTSQPLSLMISVRLSVESDSACSRAAAA
jgi:hypothetical protein